MYKFIKLDYDINVSWVENSYQLTCSASPSGIMYDQPVYSRSNNVGRIDWSIDFRNLNSTPLLVHNSMIRKTSSGTKGMRFYDGICRADGSNTYLTTQTSPDQLPNVYPMYYSGAQDGDAFVGDAGLIQSYIDMTNKVLNCSFIMNNQRMLDQYDIYTWGTSDVMPVSHVFAFEDSQSTEYNAFLTNFGSYANPYYSNRFAWQIEDDYLPEHMGFARVAPTPLPPTICKLYIGDDPVENLWVGDDPAIKCYFRNNVVWQKEVY